MTAVLRPSLGPFDNIDELKTALINGSFADGALRFGSFVLKGGRVSPYFFNAGDPSSGRSLQPVALAYAHALHDLPAFDVLFGPAYKGIPFAALACMALYTQYGVSVGYAYNRKEVKDHGEGGSTVGAPLKGKKVVVLDDVMTSGKAVRSALALVVREGGQVVGVVELLDTEEVGGREGVKSTVQELEEEAGVKVRSVLGMRDVLGWMERRGMGEIGLMREYWEKYGVERMTAKASESSSDGPLCHSAAIPMRLLSIMCRPTREAQHSGYSESVYLCFPRRVLASGSSNARKKPSSSQF
ncbi:orotate phosphoribosyltransferase [Calocera viscosa TUFC12733]|uniref:orotate phosphoribosyltransferase n=1 Tax=Calocera viscosa (strain TUFC12733) TaxID=1330018 RepID=A0A167ITL6_CALVF|nr:orotate phosphoribosyltransferase [Calocera viscosa TUFC12733]